MDEQPEQPGDQARELEPTDLADGGAAADGRQHPLVNVMEGLAREALECGEDVPRGLLALLDRGRRHARD